MPNPKAGLNPHRPKAKSSLTSWTLAKLKDGTTHAFLPTVTFDLAAFCQAFAILSNGLSHCI
jgi:hypothetical protein